MHGQTQYIHRKGLRDGVAFQIGIFNKAVSYEYEHVSSVCSRSSRSW